MNRTRSSDADPSTRLRILQVGSAMRSVSGGTEKHILDISSALADRGHAVTLACPREFRIPTARETLRLSRIPLETQGPYGAKRWLRLARVLAGNYDVVHTHLPTDYVAPALAARVAGVPVVVMTRHLPSPFASRRRAYACSAIYGRIIAVSGFIRDVLVRSGARPERVEVVHNGIPLTTPDARASWYLREELGIPQDAVLVAAAGRISAGKGFDILLRAVYNVRRAGTSVYCVIFGSGPLLEDLRALSTDLQIGASVRMPGFRKDVQDLWHAADIAVVPSVWPEPLGYVAIEALSAGCPVIASHVGGLPEVVSHDSGILIQPGDAEGLASAIQLLVLSPELRHRMRQAAERRAEQFTLDATIGGLERIYTELLHRRKPTADNRMPPAVQ